MKQQLITFRFYLLAVLLLFSSSVLFAQTTPRWDKVSAGNSFNIAISSSGGYKNVPQQVPGNTWVSVGAGWKSSFAIKSDGSLWAWGENNFGQLGLGNTTDLNVPTQVGSKNWTSVDGGNSHAMAVDENNTLWAWGKNDKGQLGDNSTVDKTSPVQISTDYFYNASCGADQSYAVSGGFYYGCGDYRSQTDSALTVIKVNPLYEGGYVQAFNKTAIFIDENNGGVIYGIGDNSNGQFGNGTTISSDTFVTLNKVFSSQFGFSVGMTHSAIIEGSPNYLLCMAGQNGKRQLGSLIPSTLSRIYSG